MPVSKKHGSSAKHQSAREMWLQAVKNRSPGLNGTNRSSKGFSTTKKSPSEYWIGSLRKGTGFQNEIAAMDTFGSNNRPAGESVPYLSTSHYLRERAGYEKGGNKRSPSADARAPPGTPAYKTPEEYYDEVLELRKQIGILDKDNSTLRAKLRRVEEDNTKKEREMEALLDPTKSGDLRRTLTDRKPDASAVVHSMKQRMLKLEQQLKEKEQAMSAMKSDVRQTNIEELRMKMEMMYQEIVRLRNQKGAREPQNNIEKRTARSAREPKESSAKLKALNETILRMNEKNVRLTTENKALMEDMEKLMNEAADAKDRRREYEDMSRKQLTGVVARLEQRLEKQEADNMSILSSTDGKRADTSAKAQLDGSMAERLETLDKRENELLEEIKTLKVQIKKLKEDRLHYRQKTDEKNKEVKALKKEIDELHKELDMLYDNDRQAPLSARRPSGTADGVYSQARRGSARGLSRAEREKKVQHFRENHAAKKIQRGWRAHQTEQFEISERDQRVAKFKDERAARRIQSEWLKHQQKKYDHELDDAATLIQSAARGNRNRKQQLSRYQEEEDEEELSDAAELIQSSVRGHWNRQKFNRDRSLSMDRRSAGSPSPYERSGSEYDMDEAAAYIQSAVRGHNSRKQYLTENSTRPSSGRTSYSLKSDYKSPRSGRAGRKQSLDSAGEDGYISEELMTPRQRRNSALRNKSKPKPPPSEDEDDDDDIMF